MFHDENGRESQEYNLDNKGHNDFENGNTDTFLIHGLIDFGKITKIEVWRKGWRNDNWFADNIRVENHNTGTEHVFFIKE